MGQCMQYMYASACDITGQSHCCCMCTYCMGSKVSNLSRIYLYSNYFGLVAVIKHSRHAQNKVRKLDCLVSLPALSACQPASLVSLVSLVSLSACLPCQPVCLVSLSPLSVCKPCQPVSLSALTVCLLCFVPATSTGFSK